MESANRPATTPTEDVAAIQPTETESNRCFGIPNDFSGRLNEQQEAEVPVALRKAYHIEAVRDMTASQLANQTKVQTKLAQETHDGIEYVALQNYRHVHFEDGVSGLMIVIERYRIRED